jgi:hypothetical protein
VRDVDAHQAALHANRRIPVHVKTGSPMLEREKLSCGSGLPVDCRDDDLRDVVTRERHADRAHPTRRKAEEA